jgi:hypothetical protein
VQSCGRVQGSCGEELSWLDTWLSVLRCRDSTVDCLVLLSSLLKLQSIRKPWDRMRYLGPLICPELFLGNQGLVSSK